ncbi:MAG: 50S ribosomal protein L10 [Candidatus Spechtbacteria bacterium SB0662_bin_43]|uniref:Large ribosomal subunit protein uL10 n=1 Tax=Candidatus Spechtbacteria bacterium SB0662_bin_43 TaxID=2604897 RepID=A0A845DJE1_9BACT|nr:50S ribosomal protein L10 [Candidatus Spechtbacteria bacterium SB0662_bin_43]
MAISKTKKQEVVSELKKAFGDANIVIFTDFSGMDVASITHLRSRIREAGGRYIVAKKNLMYIALQDKNIEGIDPRTLEGEIAIALSESDSVMLAKTIHSFAKDDKKPVMLSAIMDSQILSRAEVEHLATLPSKDELHARVVGSINAPAFGLARALSDTMRRLVYVLNAIAEQKR